jgi:hypothetical protein
MTLEASKSTAVFLQPYLNIMLVKQKHLKQHEEDYNDALFLLFNKLLKFGNEL